MSQSEGEEPQVEAGAETTLPFLLDSCYKKGIPPHNLSWVSCFYT